MKKEQQNNSTSNALVTTTQGILDNGQKELIAGGKVRSKAGGPEMVLVGFTTEKSYFSKGELGSELTYGQLDRLAMKVIMNEEGEYGYCKTFHAQYFYAYYLNRYDNGEWDGRDEYSSNPFYCLCKYWSNKDEEFKHILLLPSEIEFI